MASYSISKSSFLKFEQCSKAFFLYKKHPYLRDKLSIDKRLTFKRGNDVGFFAQKLFPGGIDVSVETKNATQAYELTQKLIESKQSVIYEATFIFKEVLIMADILHYENGRYFAYEVKSSIKVSEVYLRDACLQYYVLKNSLPGFEDLFLTTLNADYILEGEIDPRKLFKKRSVKKEAEKNFGYFEDKIKDASLLIEMNAIPNISVGKHCFKPYPCDFFDTCWKDIANEESIFNLPFINKDKLFEWHEAGIKNVSEIKDEWIEKPGHLKIKNAFVNKSAIINRQKISELLATMHEPLAAIDMEIWSAAIPQLAGTKPFQQIPFLFCISDGYKENYFLSEHFTDEREKFAQELIAQTEKYNTLLVYDKTMEELAINGLKSYCSEYARELEKVKEKFVDVFDIFRDLHYYDSKFKNNFSLKTLSEVFNTGVTYSDIQSGLEAMNQFEVLRNEPEGIEKQRLRQNLIDYCMNDATATLKLVEYLKKL